MTYEVGRRLVGGEWVTNVADEGGGSSSAASDVTVSPTVAGESNVQDALEALESGGSQPVTPDQVSGLSLWFDASTLDLADNDQVATWPDLSDNGFDATSGDVLNEMQTVDITGASEGVWGLSSAEDGTSALAWNASAGDIEDALEVLSDIGVGNVAVTLAGQIYTVEFVGALAGTPVAELTATQDTLDVEPVVQETQVGIDPRPVYKTALQNGLGGVTFDEEVPQWMDLLTAGDVLMAKDGATVLCVAYVNGAIGGTATLYISQNGDATKLRFSAEPGQYNNQLGVGLDGSGGTLLPTVAGQVFGTMLPGALFVFMGTVDMLHDTVLVACGSPNGEAQAAGSGLAPFDDTASDLVRLFGDTSNFQSGALFEIVLYDRALNALERRQIFEYLSAKWATV